MYCIWCTGVLYVLYLVHWCTVCIVSGALVYCMYCIWCTGVLYVLYLVHWCTVCIVSGTLVYCVYCIWYTGVLCVLYLVHWCTVCIVSGTLVYCVYCIWYTSKLLFYLLILFYFTHHYGIDGCEDLQETFCKRLNERTLNIWCPTRLTTHCCYTCFCTNRGGGHNWRCSLRCANSTILHDGCYYI